MVSEFYGIARFLLLVLVLMYSFAPAQCIIRIQLARQQYNVRAIIIGIVEKVQETSLRAGMHNRAITVLYELWMCLGKQTHTHITLCNR